ncbi:unnamed protein product [Auanema sp. JU1783]|nr:unnamed protein product [Auanema sp. JU1783]
MTDHLSSTSFENFQWVPESVDVFDQVHTALFGKPLKGKIVNDLDKFQTIHEPQCGKDYSDLKYKLLIIVKSSVQHSKARDIIRTTWGNEKFIEDYLIRTIFIIGQFPDDKEQLSMSGAIQRESELHGDILVIDKPDVYNNNILKFLYSIRYAHRPSNECSPPDFVLLIDDDYMLSTHNLIKLLNERSSTDEMYEGWMFNTSPFRFKLHKHAISVNDYPYNRYPPYITAGAVLLSKSTVDRFFYAIQLVKLFPFDDVYAGIVSYLLRIRPDHNDKFLFWSRDVSHEEWMDGEVICAHGYNPSKMEEEFPLVRFTVPG